MEPGQVIRKWLHPILQQQLHWAHPARREGKTNSRHFHFNKAYLIFWGLSQMESKAECFCLCCVFRFLKFSLRFCCRFCTGALVYKGSLSSLSIILCFCINKKKWGVGCSLNLKAKKRHMFFTLLRILKITGVHVIEIRSKNLDIELIFDSVITLSFYRLKTSRLASWLQPKSLTQRQKKSWKTTWWRLKSWPLATTKILSNYLTLSIMRANSGWVAEGAPTCQVGGGGWTLFNSLFLWS